MKNVEQSNQKNGVMLDLTLVEHLKSIGAKSATKMVGPNGAFISYVNKDDQRNTIPVGGNSQHGTLNEYKLIQAENGTLIATVNEYKDVETIDLAA